MSFRKKFANIFLNALPVIIMIALIPVFKNDYILTGIYCALIIIFFLIKYEKREYLFVLFGLLIITVFEYFFVSTGVETFDRHSLLGVMPLWLPFLWAYSFVAIKRAVVILDK